MRIKWNIYHYVMHASLMEHFIGERYVCTVAIFSQIRLDRLFGLGKV